VIPEVDANDLSDLKESLNEFKEYKEYSQSQGLNMEKVGSTGSVDTRIVSGACDKEGAPLFDDSQIQ